MKIDGLEFIDQSFANNFSVDHGPTLPSASNNIGELFFLTSGVSGMYIYDSANWQLVNVGPAVSPAWGAISGNLTNQIDLVSALNLKANSASPTFTGTVAGITPAMVGLGLVNNTSDTSKPVSSAQQTALNLKANLASPTFTGTVAGITPAMVGLGLVNNTADTAKPVSSAQQTALNLKANLASPTFTGIPVAPTAALGTSSKQIATTEFVLANKSTGGGSSLPVGGTTGQLLAKTSNIDGAVGWVPAPIGGSGGALPAGGTAGQVLSKTTATDGDAAWTTPASGGGGGGGSTITQAVSTASIVIQTLVPVTLASLPLVATHAYRVRFEANLNDNSNTKGIKFCVGNLSTRAMALRVSYIENGKTQPTFALITEGDDTGTKGVYFLGSMKSGEGNLVIIEGNLIAVNNTTLSIRAYNGDSQYDYRQFVAGCLLSVQDFGVVSTA